MRTSTGPCDARIPDRQQPIGTTAAFGTAVVLLVRLLLTPACRSDPLAEDERAPASAAIYAAVTQQLVEFNNTFVPDHRFSEVLVVDHVEADAGDHRRQGPSGDPLTGEERAAIEAAIEGLSPVRFIGSRSELIEQDVLQPVIPGSAIVTLAPVEFDREGATVGANLWCGASAVSGSPTGSPRDQMVGRSWEPKEIGPSPRRTAWLPIGSTASRPDGTVSIRSWSE